LACRPVIAPAGHGEAVAMDVPTGSKTPLQDGWKIM